jgi:hypothetical protein
VNDGGLTAPFVRLLRESIAPGVIAEERHEADFAAEALSGVIHMTGTRLQHPGSPGDRLRAVTQERDEVAFFSGQLRLADGLGHGGLLLDGFSAWGPRARAGLLSSL